MYRPVDKMQEKRRFLLAVFSWSSLVSVIALQRLFVAPGLEPLDWALIFLASTFAGAVLGILENIILGFPVTVLLSSLIIGAILALPATLGLAGPLYGPVALQQAIILVLQALFPFTIILMLVGGVGGGILAEWFGLA